MIYCSSSILDLYDQVMQLNYFDHKGLSLDQSVSLASEMIISNFFWWGEKKKNPPSW